jgi:hypothetical protein
MEKVAGILEVHRTHDTHEIVIRYPISIKASAGLGEITFAPRYARHLANVLIEQANYAEVEKAGALPQSRPYRRRLSDQDAAAATHA